MEKKTKGFAGVETIIFMVGILATISIGTFQGYTEAAQDAQSTSNVHSVSIIVKTSRATSTTNQYVFSSAQEIKDTLEAQGLSLPEFNSNSCYAYAYSTATGSDFFIAAPAHSYDATKVIADGTSIGLRMAEEHLSQDSLRNCNTLPTVPGYTLIKL